MANSPKCEQERPESDEADSTAVAAVSMSLSSSLERRDRDSATPATPCNDDEEIEVTDTHTYVNHNESPITEAPGPNETSGDSSIDASKDWLSRGNDGIESAAVTALPGPRNNTRRADASMIDAVEDWLTRGKGGGSFDLLHVAVEQWKAERCNENDSNAENTGHPHHVAKQSFARSTLSSPGKFSLRERLRRTLLEQHIIESNFTPDKVQEQVEVGRKRSLVDDDILEPVQHTASSTSNDNDDGEHCCEVLEASQSHTSSNDDNDGPCRETAKSSREGLQDKQDATAPILQSPVELTRTLQSVLLEAPPPPPPPRPIKEQSASPSSVLSEPPTPRRRNNDNDETAPLRHTIPSQSPSRRTTTKKRSKQQPRQLHIGHSYIVRETPSQNHASLLRLSRTVRFGRRGQMPGSSSSSGIIKQRRQRGNRIRLHIYDLLRKDTIMSLPFGMEFPIGQCFQSMNDGLHALGTGAYHCGVEVSIYTERMDVGGMCCVYCGF
jgi:hypothetical protein